MTQTYDLEISATLHKGRGVFARRTWTPGAIVISARVTGTSPYRTCHSFQTAPETHCEFDEPAKLLNHSCAPNLGIRDNPHGAFDFIAIDPIAIGDELTWNYASSEYESIAVPRCHCGTSPCRGVVRGYRYLGPSERLGMRYVAGYLRADAF